MTEHIKNPFIKAGILPVDIVFHPSWWHMHARIIFDEDFFYHPLKRVEVEKQMEYELYERFGQYGLGKERNQELPVVGAVHNASGYLLSEMLGCKVKYQEDSAPQVIPAGIEKLEIDRESAFRSPAFKRFSMLRDQLKIKFGYVSGDFSNR